jgi:Periplasmic component of the Tol biopolymer transport system
VREVTWSPDSKRLAVIADLPGGVPHAQLWLADAGTMKTRRLADLTGFAQTPRFSPDGQRLALLFISGIPRIAGPLQPMTPLAGVVDEKIYEQRITLVDLNSGAVKPVTPADMYVYEYDWTPDGSGWAATAAHGSGDNNWWIARLYLADASSGQLRQLYAPKLQICEPRVSPDGKQVAFIEGIMSDAGLNGGDVHVISIAGGEARDITPGIKASPSTLNWKAEDKIVFGEFVDGKAGFGSVSPADDNVQTLWTGEEWASTDANNVIVAASLAQNGTSSAVHPAVERGAAGGLGWRDREMAEANQHQ